MTTDTFDHDLEQQFRRLEAASHTLAPEAVIASGRRRRMRHRVAITGGAALATAVIAVVGASVADVTEAPLSPQPPAASQPTAAPLPQIANGAWTRLSSRTWFRIDGHVWRLGDPPTTKEWTGSGETVGGAALNRGWDGPSTMEAGKGLGSMMFIRGDVQRVVYTVTGAYGDFRHQARVYRLASMPGWVLAYAEYPAPGPLSPQGAVEVLRVGLDAYAADGSRIMHCDKPGIHESKAEAAAAPPSCSAG